jgi:hypothetical protein
MGQLAVASSTSGSRISGKKRVKSVKSESDDDLKSNDDRECERRYQNNARERLVFYL